MELLPGWKINFFCGMVDWLFGTQFNCSWNHLPTGNCPLNPLTLCVYLYAVNEIRCKVQVKKETFMLKKKLYFISRTPILSGIFHYNLSPVFVSFTLLTTKVSGPFTIGTPLSGRLGVPLLSLFGLTLYYTVTIQIPDAQMPVLSCSELRISL